MRSACPLVAIVLIIAAFPTAGYSRNEVAQSKVSSKTPPAVLPGVTVEARSPSLVGTPTAVTDARGTYRFPALTPGVYEVGATLQGFRLAKVESVRLPLGQVLRVDLTLGLAAPGIGQVTAESPLIDVKQNSAAATITADVIERIPTAATSPI